MIQNIVIWLIVSFLWLASIYYSHYIADFFGTIQRAEKKLWWTRQLVLLIWIIISFIGLLFVFWVLDKADISDSQKWFNNWIIDDSSEFWNK